MKVIVIGATGTIGAAVVKALAAKKHDVIGASRRGEPRVSIDDAASIRAMFDRAGEADAVICCAGNAVFKPFAQLTDGDYEVGLRSKLMGQVAVARVAAERLREGGAITLTTGILAMQPAPGSAAISLVNAGLEGFVRAAALEMPRRIRINAVSPPWVTETLIQFGMDPGPGQPAAEVARAYVASVEGGEQGKIFDPQRLEE